MKYLILILLLCSLQSCSPSLQSGGWIAVAGTALLGVIFAVIAIRKSMNLEVKITKINESLFALILFILAIGIYIWMQSAK